MTRNKLDVKIIALSFFVGLAILFRTYALVRVFINGISHINAYE
jgi:hypothetical protein